MIVDGKNLILGRAAAHIAKKALLGEKVDVINCESMVITGSKKNVIDKYKRKKSMGVPSKGPFQPRRPDMFVRKVIRGMIPYKQHKGKVAYQKVRCYIGKPSNINENVETIKVANIDKVPNLKYIQIKEICKELGWQK
jgi:large subunit ribosomal protein L13